MNYPIKTINQIQPILRGFRKAAGLTQQAMAEKLGITQQSYAQLESNPAAASMERLFKVLRMLDVELVLTVNAPSVPDQDSGNASPAQPRRIVATSKKKESW
ncbi:helix-turn-helix transcriptional regulator [Paraherbaspirillum soli]|uniref:Helix-turn-helix transcriptional regulator n=1 Tax=Paraherbaspirillum soli TaxID=631222 RepID=A0ABW0M772_9BURK